MPVIDHWDLELTADDVLRAQGGDPAVIRTRKPVLVDMAEKALVEGFPFLQPMVLYKRFRINEVSHQRILLSEQGKLSGSLVWEHLAPASDVVVALVSVGDALEKRAATLTETDLAYALALDAVGSAAVEALSEEVCAYIEQLTSAEGLKVSMPINPGMLGWPLLEGQNEIFQLLDGPEIGVHLHPSGRMYPNKSLSMVIGLGKELSGEGIPCDYCGKKDRCRHRITSGDNLSKH